MAFSPVPPSSLQIRLTEHTQPLGQIEVNGVVYNVKVIGGTITDTQLGQTMDKVYAIAKTILGTATDATRVDITESKATIYKDGQAQRSIEMNSTLVANRTDLGNSKYQLIDQKWATTSQDLDRSIGRQAAADLNCSELFKSIFDAARAGSSSSSASGGSPGQSQSSLLSSRSASASTSPASASSTQAAATTKSTPSQSPSRSGKSSPASVGLSHSTVEPEQAEVIEEPTTEDATEDATVELTPDADAEQTSDEPAAVTRSIDPSSDQSTTSQVKALKASLNAWVSVACANRLISNEDNLRAISSIKGTKTVAALKELSEIFFQRLNKLTEGNRPEEKALLLTKVALALVTSARKLSSNDREACCLLLGDAEYLYKQSCKHIRESPTAGEDPSSQSGDHTNIGLEASRLEERFRATLKSLEDSVRDTESSSKETSAQAPLAKDAAVEEGTREPSAPSATSTGPELAAGVPAQPTTSLGGLLTSPSASSGSDADRMPIARWANHAREHRFFNAKMTSKEFKDGLTKFEARANDRNPIPEYSALYEARTEYTTMDEARKNQLVLAALKKALTDNSTTIVKYLLMRFRPSNAVLKPALIHVNSLRDMDDSRRDSLRRFLKNYIEQPENPPEATPTVPTKPEEPTLTETMHQRVCSLADDADKNARGALNLVEQGKDKEAAESAQQALSRLSVALAFMTEITQTYIGTLATKSADWQTQIEWIRAIQTPLTQLTTECSERERTTHVGMPREDLVDSMLWIFAQAMVIKSEARFCYSIKAPVDKILSGSSP
jgi:hypothetical protein